MFAPLRLAHMRSAVGAIAAATAVNDRGDEFDDGPVARINFRPPESLKARIEEAAARERLSVNAWLVRATSAAVEARPKASTASGARNRLSGWVG